MRDSDRTRPAVHKCEHCDRPLLECECGDWWPADSLFDDPESEEDDDE